MTSTHRRRRKLLGALGSCVLAGCAVGFDFNDYDTTRPALSTDAGAPPADAGSHVELANLPPFAVRRGGSATLTVAIDRRGVAGAIDLTVTDLPPGVTVAPATIAALATTASLSFTAGPSSALMTSTVTVHAALGGVAQDDEPLQLTVAQSRFDPTFGDGGIIIGGPNEVFGDLQLDGAENAYLAVTAPPVDSVPLGRLLIYRFDGSGASTTPLTVRGSDTDYLFSLAPDGFFVLDTDSNQLTHYFANGERGWSAILPAVTGLDLDGILTTSEGDALVLADGTPEANGPPIVILARYTGDGGLADPAFGDGGVATLPLSYAEDAPDDFLLTDGGIVLAIDRVDPASRYALGLARFTFDGVLDETFADGGAAFTFGDEGVECSQITTDGRSIVAALAILGGDDPSFVAGLARFNAGDGTLDRSFGSAGLVKDEWFGPSSAVGAAIGPNGEVFIATASGVDRATPVATVTTDFPDGGPNVFFGLGDGGAFPIQLGTTSRAGAIRVLANGTILVAGTATIAGASTWFLVRFLP